VEPGSERNGKDFHIQARNGRVVAWNGDVKRSLVRKGTARISYFQGEAKPGMVEPDSERNGKDFIFSGRSRARHGMAMSSIERQGFHIFRAKQSPAWNGPARQVEAGQGWAGLGKEIIMLRSSKG